ncbi:hypothetical protein ACJMQP_03885 [Rhodopseudomonas palustris]
MTSPLPKGGGADTSHGAAARLYAIDAPHFYAGLLVRDGRVIAAAPILRWAIGRKTKALGAYFKRKGWKWTRCNGTQRDQD